MEAQTNLHLVHDGICAQDVVLLLRISLCMLYGPGSLSTGRQANHHQDLKQVKKPGSFCIIFFFKINFSVDWCKKSLFTFTMTDVVS